MGTIKDYIVGIACIFSLCLVTACSHGNTAGRFRGLDTESDLVVVDDGDISYEDKENLLEAGESHLYVSSDILSQTVAAPYVLSSAWVNPDGKELIELLGYSTDGVSVNNEVSYDRWNISGMEFSWDRYGRLIIDYGTQGHLPDINQGRCLADDIVEKIVSKYNLGEFTFLETDTESVYYASTPTTYTTVYRYVSGYEGLAFLSDAYRPNFNSYDSTIDGVCIEICVSDLGISAIKLNNVSVITDAGVNQSKDILDMEDICYRTAEFLNDYQIYGNTYLFTVTATDIVYVPCQYDADGSYKGACRLDLSGVFRNNGENKQMNISVLVDLETGNIMGLIS